MALVRKENYNELREHKNNLVIRQRNGHSRFVVGFAVVNALTKFIKSMYGDRERERARIFRTILENFPMDSYRTIIGDCEILDSKPLRFHLNANCNTISHHENN